MRYMPRTNDRQVSDAIVPGPTEESACWVARRNGEGGETDGTREGRGDREKCERVECERWPQATPEAETEREMDAWTGPDYVVYATMLIEYGQITRGRQIRES